MTKHKTLREAGVAVGKIAKAIASHLDDADRANSSLHGPNFTVDANIAKGLSLFDFVHWAEFVPLFSEKEFGSERVVDDHADCNSWRFSCLCERNCRAVSNFAIAHDRVQ